jgi:polysaccharide deacetylase 2 family uncharacterized protein YibQ
MPPGRIVRDSGGSGRWILLAIVLIVGGAVVGVYVAGDRVAERLHGWFASGGGADLAEPPQPRIAASGGAASGAAAPGTTDLSEMPALVATGAAAPETWPDLAPSDLLAQSGALADRALKDAAFDQPPWRRFARPFAAPAGRPLIGFLVTGLGIDRGVTAAAIAGLPADVSLSFSPYAADLADWIAAARAFGHEAMVDLPLQSKEKRDLGAHGVLVALNEVEADRRIDAVASAAPRSFGLAGDGGDALLLDDTATAVALKEIARLGLAFIDTSGEPMSLTLPTAQQAGLAAARSTVTLDARPSRGAIEQRLADAAQRAQEQGSALAVARASPLTVTAIADWLRRQGDQGPVPAPASALLQRE